MSGDRRQINNSRWRRFRLFVLDRDGWSCQVDGCGAILSEGRGGQLAAIVDHTVPRDLRPDMAFDADNCRAICKACHDGPMQAIEMRYAGDPAAIAKAKAAFSLAGYDASGRPLAANHPWNGGSEGA